MAYRKNIYRADRRNSSRPLGSRSMGKYKKYRYAKENQRAIRSRFKKRRDYSRRP